MSDLIDNPAILRALDLFDVVETDLKEPQKSIVLHALTVFREKAIDGMRLLIEADAENAAQILSLQCDIRMYANMIATVRSIQTRAREAWARLSIEEREAIFDVMNPQANNEVNDA